MTTVPPKSSKPVSLTDLRTTLEGRVIAPDDAGYDAVRTTFYGGIDRRPAAIVRVANADDISRIILLAREDGVKLAIRSGHHDTRPRVFATRKPMYHHPLITEDV